MDEEKVKPKRWYRVQISDRNDTFISVLNERTYNLLQKRMRERLLTLVEKLRRGAKI